MAEEALDDTKSKKIVEPRYKKLASSILQEIGPILAGFQLAGTLVSLYGFGAFARWIVEAWQPFTYWAWDRLTNFLNLPILTEPEKDALTAVAFFVPMAIWSVFRKFVLKRANLLSPIMWWASLGLSFWFIYLVSGPLMWRIAGSLNSGYQFGFFGVKFTITTMYIICAAWLAFSIVLVVVSLLMYEQTNQTMLSDPELRISGTYRQVQLIRSLDNWKIALGPIEKIDKVAIDKLSEEREFLSYWFTREKEWLSTLLPIEIEELKLSRNLRNQLKRLESRSNLWSKLVLLNVVATMISLFSLAVAASFSVAAEMAITVAISVWLVVVGIVLTLAYDPRRILVTMGALISVLMGAVLYDGITWVSDWIERLGVGT